MLRFFIDEPLPHDFVRLLADRGYPDVVHPIHIGMRGRRDDEIIRRALDEDRIIITTNAEDYRDLLAHETIHPGLILLPHATREAYWKFIVAVIELLEREPAPADYMINRVIEVSALGDIRTYDLPSGD